MLTTGPPVRRLRRSDARGTPAAVAALRSGMGAETARKYRRLGRLPREVRMPHSWRTHPDPLADAGSGVVERRALHPGLEALTLFRPLPREHPGRLPGGQLRTFQRRVKTWRAAGGPAKEVLFAQVHAPGRLCAPDLAHMTDRRVTTNGRPADHLIDHVVPTSSNGGTGTVGFAGSFESPADGSQNAPSELGGVPAVRRTDRLTAASPPGTAGAEFARRYRAPLNPSGLVRAGAPGRARPRERGHRAAAPAAQAGARSAVGAPRQPGLHQSRSAPEVPRRSVRPAEREPGREDGPGGGAVARAAGASVRGGGPRRGEGGCGPHDPRVRQRLLGVEPVDRRAGRGAPARRARGGAVRADGGGAGAALARSRPAPHQRPAGARRAGPRAGRVRGASVPGRPVPGDHVPDRRRRVAVARVGPCGPRVPAAPRSCGP